MMDLQISNKYLKAKKSMKENKKSLSREKLFEFKRDICSKNYA